MIDKALYLVAGTIVAAAIAYGGLWIAGQVWCARTHICSGYLDAR